MGVWLTIIKEFWSSILNAFAWLTQDSPGLNKTKRKTNMKHEAIASQMRFRLWR